jgi:dihydroneopterin aldolase
MIRATPLGPVALSDTRPKVRAMFIRDLVIECSIGIHRHERGAPQRVRIDIDLTVRDDAPVDDNITNVISYDDIVEGVKSVAAAGHINLVETLADRIGDFCMTDRRVTRARVRVEKQGAVADVAGVGIEIERVSDRT